MTYHVRHWLGDTEGEGEFATTRFGELLDELAEADDEHPDISVTHESEWCLSVGKSGALILENLEENEPVHMTSADRAMTLALMVAVAEGRIEDARSAPWKAGYPR